jgi:hypothetical protein
VAAKDPSRPLYNVFLERVIRIDAVQRHRAVVTDDHTAEFFAKGRRPGVFGDFHWSLDRPEPFPSGPVAGMVFLWGPIPPATSEEPPVSLPMQHAWDAAVAAWADFIAELVNGELIASGVYFATGDCREIIHAEWRRTGLILDVRNGDLIETRHGKHTVRWSAIVVRAAIQQPKLGAIDWDAEWNEDVARREKGQLPNEKAYVRELETRIKGRYSVTSVDGGDLRRFKAALYRGDLVRPRKR